MRQWTWHPGVCLGAKRADGGEGYADRRCQSPCSHFPGMWVPGQRLVCSSKSAPSEQGPGGVGEWWAHKVRLSCTPKERLSSSGSVPLVF
jgi:hypothetical protein